MRVQVLTSIDKGTKKGPDYNLIEKLVTYSNITNIYSGGVAEYKICWRSLKNIKYGRILKFVFYGQKVFRWLSWQNEDI